MKEAIILAAGQATRMYKNEENKIPKSLISIDNIPILGRLIDALLENGFLKIYIIVGNLKEKIIQFINNHNQYSQYSVIFESKNYIKGPIFSFNDFINYTEIQENFLLCSSDLIIDPKSIMKMLEAYQQNKSELLIAIDKKYISNGTTVRVEDKNKTYGKVISYNFTNKKDLIERKIIPISILSKRFLKYIKLAINSRLSRVIDAMNLYILDNNPTYYIDLSDYYWFDVDDKIILSKVRRFFNNKKKI